MINKGKKKRIIKSAYNIVLTTTLAASLATLTSGCSNDAILKVLLGSKHVNNEDLQEINDVLGTIDEKFAKNKHKDFGPRIIKVYGKTTEEEEGIPEILMIMRDEQTNYLPAYRGIFHVFYPDMFYIKGSETSTNINPGTYDDDLRWFPYKATLEEFYPMFDIDEKGVAVEYCKGYFVKVGTTVYLITWKNMPTELDLGNINLEDMPNQKVKRFR